MDCTPSTSEKVTRAPICDRRSPPLREERLSREPPCTERLSRSSCRVISSSSLYVIELGWILRTEQRFITSRRCSVEGGTSSSSTCSSSVSARCSVYAPRTS